MKACCFARVAILAFAVLAAGTPYVHALQTEKTTLVFEKQKIRLAGKTIEVEIADSPEKRERGMMFRTSLEEGHGMLFVFDDERPLSFWMRNTLIPLSIGYFDGRRKLINTHEMVPAVMGEVSPKTYPSSKPARYALEMPKGWFSKHRVRPGAELTFLKPVK